ADRRAVGSKVQGLIPRYGRVSLLGDRSFIDAVIFVLKTGAAWRDLPERYGRWKTVYNRFANWSKAGHFRQIFEALKVHLDRSGSLVDATIARAHQDAAGGKGGSKSITWVVHTADFRPKSTRSSMPRGRPLHVELTPGHSSTRRPSPYRYWRMRKGGAFIEDAGYDAESIRSAAKARGMKVVIPSNPTRAVIHRY